MSSRRWAAWLAAALLAACGSRVVSGEGAGGGTGGAGSGGAGSGGASGGGGTGSAGAGAASSGGADSGASGAAGGGGVTPADAAPDVPVDGVACVSDDECAVAERCRKGWCNEGRCAVRLRPPGYVCTFFAFCDDFGECRDCDWNHLELVCPKPSNYCCWQQGVVRKCKGNDCFGEFVEPIYHD